MSNVYDDIINLPHHVSATRTQMSAQNRAAQFAPFAALTGYDATIKETARLTDKRIELGESAIAALDMKLLILAEIIADHPEVAVTHFKSDEKKDGGAYITVNGALKRIDDYEKVLALMNGEKISIENILDIECELSEALI